MKIKRWLIALSASALGLGMLAGPAAASPVLDLSGFNPSFTGTFGAVSLTSISAEFECGGENHVTGSYATNGLAQATTGSIQMTLTNCHTTGSVNIPCTTSGRASGEIAFGSSEFHLGYIKGFTHTVGALVTPPISGRFAAFSCSFFESVEIRGSGVIAHIPSPACGAKSSNTTFAFERALHTVQKYQEMEGNSTIYHLTATVNGGSPDELALSATSTTTNLAGITGTLTCL